MPSKEPPFSTLPDDTCFVSKFRDKTGQQVNRYVRSGRPRLLTINGRGKMVIQDATAYQKLLDAVDRAEAIAGIQRGLDDIQAGRTMPAREALESLRLSVRGKKSARRRQPK